LKYPEKISLFANQIKDLKKKIKEWIVCFQ
jgi:hypothetical protein